MADYLDQSFDFGVRIVQLTRWLKDEGKEFPLIQQLLDCGTGLGISLREANALNNSDYFIVALKQAEESEYLLELMVKTSFLAELQSKPLLADCGSIKNEIRKLLPVSSSVSVENRKHKPKKQNVKIEI